MTLITLCFAGGVGSGKTEVATRLARRLELPCVGFGNYVRGVASARGSPVDREHLQALGESIITEGWDRFCRAVLSQANWHTGEGIVVEGVRHVEAIEALRIVTAPSDVVLVFLDATDRTRVQRLAAARPGDANALPNIDAHSTETQVGSALRSAARIVVDAERDVDAIVDELAKWCARRDSAHPA